VCLLYTAAVVWQFKRTDGFPLSYSFLFFFLRKKRRKKNIFLKNRRAIEGGTMLACALNEFK
jgi:hypothetical protein